MTTMKVCAKCSGPIPSPLLGDDPDERCPLCGDEPASRAELAELLRAALHGGVVAVRDYLDGQAGEWQRGAFRALDDALDDIDSAVRYLESDDYEDECGCVEGVLVGQTYGCTAPPETAILVQRCDACDLYDGDLAAAVGYVGILGYGRAHAIGDGVSLVEQSDVWVDPGGTLGPVVWHSEEYAVAAGWINARDEDEVPHGS